MCAVAEAGNNVFIIFFQKKVDAHVETYRRAIWSLACPRSSFDATCLSKLKLMQLVIQIFFFPRSSSALANGSVVASQPTRNMRTSHSRRAGHCQTRRKQAGGPRPAPRPGHGHRQTPLQWHVSSPATSWAGGGGRSTLLVVHTGAAE